jgi:hypothetical protein
VDPFSGSHQAFAAFVEAELRHVGDAL